jgi:two-component system phosphate regulon sensor histidine kinase PhoR
MRRLGIGVRWWLSLAFGVVAAAAAAAAVTVFSHRSQADFRAHAEAFAAGRSFVAAEEVMTSLNEGIPPAIAVRDAASAQRLAVSLYSTSRRVVSSSGAAPTTATARAAAAARKGNRFVASSDNGRHVVVGIPLLRPPYTALVTQTSQLALPAELQIVQRPTVRVGAIAAAAGLAVGLVLAQLIALRLRRLAAAADALSAGDFDAPVELLSADEFGSVSAALERMRVELKESFGRLEFERDRLRLLLERLREGVVTVDRDLVVQFANTHARRLLGDSLVEGAALPDGEAMQLRRRARRLFAGATAPQHARVVLADERTIGIVGIPARDASDTAMLVLADLTEDLRRELAEREFVANAAHELRTPLTTILGAVEVLQAGAKDDAEARERFVAHIGRESERLARLVRTLLVLARAQTHAELPPRERLDVGAVVERVALDLEPRHGVEVVVETDDTPLRIVSNADLLEQAVRNLAENAVKYTPSGRITLRAHERNGEVRIEVEDSGGGIPPDVRPHIFERFYRGAARDGDGYGLGLAIVQQATRVLGGRVEVESEERHGSRFTIVLAGENAHVREEAAA